MQRKHSAEMQGKLIPPNRPVLEQYQVLEAALEQKLCAVQPKQLPSVTPDFCRERCAPRAQGCPGAEPQPRSPGGMGRGCSFHPRAGDQALEQRGNLAKRRATAATPRSPESPFPPLLGPGALRLSPLPKDRHTDCTNPKAGLPRTVPCEHPMQYTPTLPIYMWNEDFPQATFQSITLWQIQ